MNIKKYMLGLCMMIILIITLCSAYAQPPFIQPPITNIILDSRLTLQTVAQPTHDINTSYYLHSHVFDSLTGHIIKNDLNLSCYYHLYSKNNNWEHVITDGELALYGDGVFDYINESYFNETDEIVILFWCVYEIEGADDIGGFNQISFSVIDDTESNLKMWSCPTSYNVIYIFIGLSIFFILFAIWKSESIFGILGGLTLVFSYLYIGACAPLLSMPLLVAGILIAVYFAFAS